MPIQADMHTHTIASTHAYSTITENCKWAAINGIKAIAMTDHGLAMPDSPHIWHFANLEVLPRTIEGTIVLKGAEADLTDLDGTLDIPEYVLKDLEWVVVSMHNQSTPKGTPEEIARAYVKAMENPYVDLIGHPSADSFQCDFDILARGAVEYDKIIEINDSSYICKRSCRENMLRLLEACAKYGAKVSVDSDSHFCQKVGIVTEAEKLIDEVGFPKELIINYDWEKLKKWIMNRRKISDL